MKHFDFKTSRRSFCLNSIAGISAINFMTPQLSMAQAKSEDHFFIIINVSGGWDPSYMFDARPLSMTKENIIQNYTNEEPFVWNGSNNNACLTSQTVAPLKAYKNDFTVLNGVLMATSFEGHDQNTNFLFTGNPFGGESFVPNLNEKGHLKKTLLTGVTSSLGIEANNLGSMVPLSPTGGQNLINNIKGTTPINFKEELSQHMLSRYKFNNSKKGKISLAKKQLAQAFMQNPLLSKKLSTIDIEVDESPYITTVKMLKNLFKQKIIRVASLNLNNSGPDQNFLNYDTHDIESAKTQPEIYKTTAERIGKYIEALKSTPYDEKRSMADVTTFMFTSEFGRTLRQKGKKIDETGTDHNPLCNSILIGGKNIKTGLVIGQSDYQSKDEKLSQVHLQKDKDKIKFMGRAFDFKTMKHKLNSPDKFNLDDYLSMNNIANSIMNQFGVPKNEYWQSTRNSDKAQILTGLFK